MKPWLLRPPLLLRQMFCSSSKYKFSFSVPRPVLSHHALAWKHFPGHKSLKYLGMTAQETLSFEWSLSVCLIMLFSPAEETIGYLPLLFSYIYTYVCVYIRIYIHLFMQHVTPKLCSLKHPAVTLAVSESGASHAVSQLLGCGSEALKSLQLGCLSGLQSSEELAEASISVSKITHKTGDRTTHFLSTWASVQGCSPHGGWLSLEHMVRGSIRHGVFLNKLILEAVLVSLCLSRLVTQSSLGTVWEGTVKSCKYQKVRII